MLAHVLTDMRYAIRQLRKTPGFTIVAVLTLAFGIGATSAIFSVVNAVMLRPLPYPEPERLVRVIEVLPQYGRFAVAPANFLDWRARNSVVRADRRVTRRAIDDAASAANGPSASTARPCRGTSSSCSASRRRWGAASAPRRTLPSTNNVIVISHGMWQRRFGGDPDVLGRSITLSGGPSTVVGVMPPRTSTFRTVRPSSGGRSRCRRPMPTRGGHLSGDDRAAESRRLDRAGERARCRGIATQLAQQYPDTNRDESAEAVRDARPASSVRCGRCC